MDFDPDLFDDDADDDEVDVVNAYGVLRVAGFDNVTAKKIALHYLLTRAGANWQDLQAAATECGYPLPAVSLTRHDS